MADVALKAQKSTRKTEINNRNKRQFVAILKAANGSPCSSVQSSAHQGNQKATSSYISDEIKNNFWNWICSYELLVCTKKHTRTRQKRSRLALKSSRHIQWFLLLDLRSSNACSLATISELPISDVLILIILYLVYLCLLLANKCTNSSKLSSR